MKLTSKDPIIFNVKNGRQKITLWDPKKSKEKTIVTTPKDVSEFLTKKEEQRKKDICLGTSIALLTAALGYFAGKSVHVDNYINGYEVTIKKETNKIIGSAVGVFAGIGLTFAKLNNSNNKLSQNFIEQHAK